MIHPASSGEAHAGDLPSSRRPVAAVITMLVLIVGAYTAALVIDGATLVRAGREDGPIENAGALGFLVASAGFLAVSMRSAKRARHSTATGRRRALIFALLALLMFVCFGEEISWGQRVFGWETPRFLSDLDVQNETNLHNLRVVNRWNLDGTGRSFFESLINMNRLFKLFWLSVFVVLPAATIISGRLRRAVLSRGVPVPPLWAGGLFLCNYGIYKVLAFVYAGSIRGHSLDELKETTYAAIYGFLAVAALIGDLRRRRIAS